MNKTEIKSKLQELINLVDAPAPDVNYGIVKEIGNLLDDIDSPAKIVTKDDIVSVLKKALYNIEVNRTVNKIVDKDFDDLQTKYDKLLAHHATLTNQFEEVSDSYDKLSANNMHLKNAASGISKLLESNLHAYSDKINDLKQEKSLLVTGYEMKLTSKQELLKHEREAFDIIKKALEKQINDLKAENARLAALPQHRPTWVAPNWQQPYPTHPYPYFNQQPLVYAHSGTFQQVKK
jgi:chromosome segregation ATPase